MLLGYLKDIRGPKVNQWMAHGLTAAFVLGLALVAIASMSDDVADPNNAKVGVKLLDRLRGRWAWLTPPARSPAPNPIAHVIAALVLVNVALAYLW